VEVTILELIKEIVKVTEDHLGKDVNSTQHQNPKESH